MKKLYFFALIAAMAMLGSCKQQPNVITEHLSCSEVVYLTDAQTDSLALQMEIDFPTRIVPDSVYAPICQGLLEELFGDAYAQMDINQAMAAYAAMIKTEFKLNNLPILEDWENQVGNIPANEEDGHGPMFCEEQIISGQVMGQIRGIFSYGIERYVYAGGAHGSNFRLFANFCMATGKRLHEQDVFVADYQEALTNLLLKKMVDQNDEIALIEDLQQAGYNIDEIHPNDNFYLSEDGITYVFNPYDIAPYALGETEILLPWDELGELVNLK